MSALYVWIVLASVMLLWVLFRFLRSRNRKIRFKREFIGNLLFVYLLAVFYLTMEPFRFTPPIVGQGGTTGFDTELFYQLSRMVDPELMLLYSFGNIALFIPFGILIPSIVKFLRYFLLTLIAGFLFSLSIEFTQLYFTVNRSATVDDLFFNTLGTAIGYVIFAMFRKWLKV
ncbi:hypothetical protein CEY16_11170 [Halalkalibacillus sediminis]|uniref:VanZ-like domain-containing protein n=1 Tax=Halalkalibacillus sediminis TaxID=2018042 RepID=A0A2I0QT49_9BACI|nr:VanZ family protein [Halalkalibacillus sediminis]PKR77290.1 hypothetical protein CEY16_11170 [Halalkalibacillus sediminis]